MKPKLSAAQLEKTQLSQQFWHKWFISRFESRQFDIFQSRIHLLCAKYFISLFWSQKLFFVNISSFSPTKLHPLFIFFLHLSVIFDDFDQRCFVIQTHLSHYDDLKSLEGEKHFFSFSIGSNSITAKKY